VISEGEETKRRGGIDSRNGNPVKEIREEGRQVDPKRPYQEEGRQGPKKENKN